MTLRAAIQQRAFSALYGPGARLYDAFTGRLFLGEWARWQTVVLPYLPAGGWILELGCGTGRLARQGVTSECHWLGLDRSAAMLRVAGSRQMNEGLTFVRGRAEQLPFAPASFDAVVSTFPAPFVLAPETAREVRRVLRPDGLAVVVISAELGTFGSQRRLRRRLLDGFYGRRRNQVPPGLSWPGFHLTEEWRPTRFGRAHTLVYRRQD